ncbi:hypothetical protein A2W24_01905 [Microgenomates group bacterium RBG_16_45_19]|nr:MAG: hypothetical protein A2W24_01905 [Microgenomates group bacterium RBG_16_45_19]
MEKFDKIAGIGTEAVKKKTGQGWKEWITILDKAGAKEMPHKDIAIHLHEKHRLPDWWCQMVAVGYEQAKGLRQIYQGSDGYKVSVGRTIASGLGDIYKAWEDTKRREKWLPKAKLTVRKATTNKSMHISWGDGKTSLEVNFYPKGIGKGQVVVQHSKLADAKEVEKKKVHWSKALDKLKEMLKG